MNAERSKELKKAVEIARQALDLLQQIKTDEEAAYDGLSESQQNGEKGEDMQAIISELEDADTSLDSAIASMESAIR